MCAASHGRTVRNLMSAAARIVKRAYTETEIIFLASRSLCLVGLWKGCGMSGCGGGLEVVAGGTFLQKKRILS